MSKDISLSQLIDCFQGIVPSLVCTFDSELTPNVSYLSHVEYLDEKHVALSNQFFSKTKRNVIDTKSALILLLHPATLQCYELHIRFLKSEMSGELFEKMSIKLSIIAANEGKSHIYKLLSADVYEVEKIIPRLGMTNMPIELPSGKHIHSKFNFTDVAQSYLDTLNASSLKVEDAIDLLLKSIRYGFGFYDSYIYLNNEQKESFIYQSAGCRYENIKELFAEHCNIIKKVTSYGKPIMLSGLQLQRRYLNSILSNNATDDFSAIARQLAIPIVHQGKVLGVLLIEDTRSEAWDFDFIHTLKIMCSSLALLLGTQAKLSVSNQVQVDVLQFNFHAESETLFLNDAAFIKSLPAKVLSYILNKKLNTSHSSFSNQEIICALQSDFPIEGKVNFEARLALIKKRLETKGLPLRLVSKGRGQFELITEPGIQYKISGYPK